jgi:very-short-patch-repair endonuclease
MKGKRWAHTHTSKNQYPKNKTFSRDMRKSPTPAEEKLWERIRKKRLSGYKFRRQHAIGDFIVDFYCVSVGLVIEVDGTIHEEQVEYDAMRQTYLESLGSRVLRFTNGEVIQSIDAVVERIGEVLLELQDVIDNDEGQQPHPPAPSPKT